MSYDAVKTASSFSDTIRARSDEIESGRRMPADLAADMAKAGLFRILTPAAYGGLEVSPQDYIDTLTHCAQDDAAVAWVLMIGTTTSTMAAGLSPEWARRIYGDNPNVITCGVTAPIGRAEPIDGGYRVSGKWPFGSASEVADWICGGSLVAGDNSGLPHLMLFPRAEVTIHDTWHTSGLCGTGSHHIEVSDAIVPDGRFSVLGKRGAIDTPLYQFPTLGLLALGVSAVAVGLAERAIEAFTELAGGKTPTGSAKPLALRGSAQSDLARSIADVRSARAFVADRVGQAWVAAQAGDRMSKVTRAELRLAASNAAWRSAEAVDRLYHAAGGSAIYHTSPLQRCFRDVHVATQHIMVAQPTFEVVGRVELGLDPKSML